MPSPIEGQLPEIGSDRGDRGDPRVDGCRHRYRKHIVGGRTEADLIDVRRVLYLERHRIEG